MYSYADKPNVLLLEIRSRLPRCSKHSDDDRSLSDSASEPLLMDYTCNCST